MGLYFYLDNQVDYIGKNSNIFKIMIQCNNECDISANLLCLYEYLEGGTFKWN